MSKIAIVTDSNSGITQKEGKELGISVIPMPFYINDELYFEKKMKALSFFHSQMAPFPASRSLEAVDALSKYRGATISKMRAEAFMVVRIIS